MRDLLSNLYWTERPENEKRFCQRFRVVTPGQTSTYIRRSWESSVSSDLNLCPVEGDKSDHLKDFFLYNRAPVRHYRGPPYPTPRTKYLRTKRDVPFLDLGSQGPGPSSNRATYLHFFDQMACGDGKRVDTFLTTFSHNYIRYKDVED